MCAALSKPHLFEGQGHNRQGSDSSVDRLIPKDEPAEPEPVNKVNSLKQVRYVRSPCYVIKHEPMKQVAMLDLAELRSVNSISNI